MNKTTRATLLALSFLAAGSATAGDVIATMPNNGGGKIYFTDEKSETCTKQDALIVLSTTAEGTMAAAGCWTTSSAGIVVSWVSGSYSIFDYGNLTITDYGHLKGAQNKKQGTSL
jgi:hypothetical protein